MTTEGFELGITYCNGQVAMAHHDDVKVATQQYADLLAEALVPPSNGGRHIRMVTLLGYDEKGDISQEINTPVFKCAHKEGEE